MEELISSTFHSVDCHWHDIPEDSLHHLVMLHVVAGDELRLEGFTFFRLGVGISTGCERLYICWRRNTSVGETLIKVEEAGFSRANVGSLGVLPLTYERLVNDTDAWTTLDSDADAVCHTLEIIVVESLLHIDRINPDSHVFCLQFFSISACTQASRSCILLDDLFQLFLISLGLLASALCSLLEERGSQDWVTSGLK